MKNDIICALSRVFFRLCKSFLILALLTFMAFAGNSSAQNQDRDNDPVKVNISVTQKLNDKWQIDYKFDRPIAAIFLGPETLAHKQGWHLADPYVVVQRDKVWNFVVRKDKATFDSLSIELDTWLKIAPYAIQPFVDLQHGVVISTGPLVYGVISSPEIELKEKNSHDVKPSFSFHALSENRVFLPEFGFLEEGQFKEIPVNNAFEGGSVAYFGKPENIIDGENITLLVTRDAATSFKDFTMDTLSSISRFLNDRIGKTTISKPVIAFGLQSYKTREWREFFDLIFEIGLLSKNQIPPDDFINNMKPQELFVVTGNGVGNNSIVAHLFTNDSIENIGVSQGLNRNEFVLFLAHEMIHLWQTECRQLNCLWYEEGMATWSSFIMGEKLFNISRNSTNESLNKLIKPALKGLKETALLHAFENKPRLNYNAGTLVMVAAQSAIDGDIFDIDQGLQQWGSTSGPVIEFTNVLRDLGASQDAVIAIEHFITTHHKDPESALLSLFDATGVEYTIDESIIKINLK